MKWEMDPSEEERLIAMFSEENGSKLKISKQDRAAALLLLQGRGCRSKDARLRAVTTLFSEIEQEIEPLKELMSKFHRPLSYEIAWTVFWTAWWSEPRKGKARLLDLAAWYLVEVPTDNASSAFEAAHLLASKWAGNTARNFL